MLDLGTLKINVEVDNGKAKSQLNELDDSIQKTGKSTNLLANLGKKLVAAFAVEKIIAGIVDIGKAALKASSDFQQLEGGMKVLFGDDADKAMANARSAFAKTGMSANQYMENTTAFASSLIQSLNGDTKAAVAASDMMMADMADNASIFGSSMESVENAYKGFAKQNYTMLDNLKLGYGGTKTEMERLLRDAEAISGVHYDINNLNDVANAIHVIQKEQGIAGNASKELAKTMEGSVNMMKASWQNFLVALGTGKGLDTAINDMVKSAGAVAKNVIPALGNIAKGLLDSVMELIPGFFTNNFGKTVMKIIKGILSYIPTFISNLADMINNIADNIDSQESTKMINTAVSLISKCVVGIIKATPQIIAAIANLIKSMISKFLSTDWVSVGKKVLTSFLNGLKSIWSSIVNWVTSKVKWIKDKFTINLGSNVTGGKLSQGGLPKRIGLREVPYDDYPALLHKGETILTAAEANQYRKYINGELPNQGTSGTVVNFNGSYSFMDKKQIDYFMREAERMIKRRLAV